MPTPWYPHRQPYTPADPGNPLVGPGPDLSPPGWNPGGTLPTQAFPRTVEAWSDVAVAKWVNNADTTWDWTWTSVLLDLRPGLKESDQTPTPSVPLNHEAALGQSVYLSTMIFCTAGAPAPASVPNLRAYSWEEGCVLGTSGSNLGGQDRIYRFTPEDGNEITDIILGGGTSTSPPFGASCLTFTPSFPGLRFWRMRLRLSVPFTDAPPRLSLHAGVH